jgi:hypothetical protein
MRFSLREDYYPNFRCDQWDAHHSLITVVAGGAEETEDRRRPVVPWIGLGAKFGHCRLPKYRRMTIRANAYSDCRRPGCSRGCQVVWRAVRPSARRAPLRAPCAPPRARRSARLAGMWRLRTSSHTRRCHKRGVTDVIMVLWCAKAVITVTECAKRGRRVCEDAGVQALAVRGLAGGGCGAAATASVDDSRYIRAAGLTSGFGSFVWVGPLSGPGLCLGRVFVWAGSLSGPGLCLGWVFLSGTGLIAGRGWRAGKAPSSAG